VRDTDWHTSKHYCDVIYDLRQRRNGVTAVETQSNECAIDEERERLSQGNRRSTTEFGIHEEEGKSVGRKRGGRYPRQAIDNIGVAAINCDAKKATDGGRGRD